MSGVLADLAFAAELVEWRGRPLVFARVPDEWVGEVRRAARAASYGWGCVPVAASVAGEAFATSLFARDGGYMLPVKVAVRRATGVEIGDVIAVTMRIEGP